MSHVLVVDDNVINLKLVCDLLECAGIEVSRAEDAQSARSALEAARPNLVLMDIGLPDMNGLELTRRLRADDRFRTLPIIALTAFAMKGDDRKALEAGCDGYITKPVDTRTFVSQIERFLRRRPEPQQ